MLIGARARGGRARAVIDGDRRLAAGLLGRAGDRYGQPTDGRVCDGDSGSICSRPRGGRDADGMHATRMEWDAVASVWQSR